MFGRDLLTLRTIGRICCAVVVTTALVVFASSEPPPASPPQWFWGCWVVKKLLQTSGVSGLSQEQAKAMVGRRLIFSTSCARSGETVASSPVYSVSTLSGQDFFSLGYVPLGQIGKKDDEVVRVQLVKPNFSSQEFAGNDLFLRESDLVIEVENDYFLADRAKSGDANCTCETDSKGRSHK